MKFNICDTYFEYPLDVKGEFVILVLEDAFSPTASKVLYWLGFARSIMVSLRFALKSMSRNKKKTFSENMVTKKIFNFSKWHIQYICVLFQQTLVLFQTKVDP